MFTAYHNSLCKRRTEIDNEIADLRTRLWDLLVERDNLTDQINQADKNVTRLIQAYPYLVSHDTRAIGVATKHLVDGTISLKYYKNILQGEEIDEGTH